MQEMRQSSVTLVLGGVRSGKSRYAQQLAERESRVIFVATAKVSDDEMQQKIERHREERPAEWITVEEPLELVQVLAQQGKNCDVMVVDCLTIFAANLLEAEGDDRPVGKLFCRAGFKRGRQRSGAGVSPGAEISRSAGRD
jgi:adenosylcobinamide kinase/adenosylcobinamide-phosphate guanylyltransferase